jgi:hypothetical protein
METGDDIEGLWTATRLQYQILRNVEALVVKHWRRAGLPLLSERGQALYPCRQRRLHLATLARAGQSTRDRTSARREM